MARHTINKKRSQAGFSLLEMLAGLAVLLIISGVALSGMMTYQNNYHSSQIRADLHASIRGAVELMSQEIAQAGLINSVDTIAADISTNIVNNDSSSATAQWVQMGQITVSGVTYYGSNLFYSGEDVQVDTGPNSEVVRVTGIDTTNNKIQGIFLNSHHNGTPVYAVGTIAEGIILPSTATSPYNTDTLDILGDINGDGTLYLVEYYCNRTNSGVTLGSQTAPANTLTRSATAVNTANKLAPSVILQGVQPGTGACFTINFSTPANVLPAYRYPTNVTFTITVDTLQNDPVTHQPYEVTKSYLDLSPRNIVGALTLEQDNQMGRVLAQPSPLPQ